MKKTVRTTGDYGIGIMIHSVHMTDDVPALNRFYEEVFGGLMYMGVDEPSFLPVEDRWAGLLLVSDLCIETMAPNMPADPTRPVGKFYTKFGRHLHSVGYKVDDLVGLGNHLIEQGVYIGPPGGGKLDHIEPSMTYFYPSPRDMYGLMAELCKVDMRDDPRLLDTWSSQVKMWEIGHPLGIRGLAYVTLGVRTWTRPARLTSNGSRPSRWPAASTTAAGTDITWSSWGTASCSSRSRLCRTHRWVSTSRAGAT
jgi:hypothetical protein